MPCSEQDTIKGWAHRSTVRLRLVRAVTSHSCRRNSDGVLKVMCISAAAGCWKPVITSGSPPRRSFHDHLLSIWMKSNITWTPRLVCADTARQFVGSEYVLYLPSTYIAGTRRSFFRALAGLTEGPGGGVVYINSGRVTAMASTTSDGNSHRPLVKQRLSGFSAGHRVACGLCPRDMYSIW